MKRRILLFLPLFLAATLSPATVDRNGNGMSDVWEMIYGAAALPPNGDADGDGFSNLAESLAGTNPFDSNSYPRLKFGQAIPSTAQLMWDSFPGKRYTLQSRTNITGAWSNEIPIVASSSVSQTNLNIADRVKFFRISI